MARRGAVELGARRITLLAQPGDEDLADVNPLALLERAGTLADVVQDVLDGFYFGDRMIELRHGRVRMDVRINQAGQYHLSLKVNQGSRWPLKLKDRIVVPDCGDAISRDGDGLVHGKLRVRCHD